MIFKCLIFLADQGTIEELLGDRFYLLTLASLDKLPNLESLKMAEHFQNQVKFSQAVAIPNT